MSLLNTLRTHLSAQKKSALARYVELLERAENPHDGDAPALWAVIAELGISVEQAEQDAAIVRDIKELTPHILETRERQLRKEQTSIAAREHAAETERQVMEIKVEREGKMMQLAKADQIATGQLGETSDAHRRLAAMSGAYKRLYPDNPLGKYLNL